MRGCRALGALLALSLLGAACRGGGTRMEIPNTTVTGLTATAGLLTVAAELPLPPLRTFDADGKVVGFEADLLTALADRLDLEVVWVAAEPGTLITDVALSRYDVGIPSEPPSRAESAAVRSIGPHYRSPDTEQRHALIVDPARADLAARLDAALGVMLADGTYQAGYDSWFDDPVGSVLYIPPAAAIGDPGRPIRLVFVPMVGIAEIRDAARDLVSALTAATGLAFGVSVPTTYAEAIDQLCAFPEESVGFVSAAGFVVASDRCDVTPALVATRFGSPVTWSQVVVARDAEVIGLADLAGLTWAHPGLRSPTGQLIPAGMLALAGVNPGAEVITDSHAAAIRAVYRGEADFATTFFRPAVDSTGTILWDGTAQNADVPDDLLWSCATISTGELVCSDGLRPRDARIGMREEARDVIQRVRILTVSEPIPNEVVVFGPGFPADLRPAIVAALLALAADDPRRFAEAFAAYAWDGLVPADESTFTWLRGLLTALDFGIADL